MTPDPVLYEKLKFSSFKTSEHEKGRIVDFFINMAICNTVVLSCEDEEELESLTTTSNLVRADFLVFCSCFVVHAPCVIFRIL